MSDQGAVIAVEIHGQRYPIRSALDPEYVGRLALYVDQKIRAAAETSPSGDSLRLAVLAALNIADEYHLIKRKLENGGVNDYAVRAQRLAGALDELLLEDKRRLGERSA